MSGWVAGQSRTLLRSADGGISWRPQTPPIPEWVNLASVAAISGTEAWVGGRNSLLHTANAGNTWGNGVWEGDYIEDIDFKATTFGMLVGSVSGGSLMKYRGPGDSGSGPDAALLAFPVGNAPAVDGDLSDWPEGTELLLNAGTAGYIHPRSIPSLDDLSGSIRALWDANNLYLGIAVVDDAIVADSVDIWRDDAVELGFDAADDNKGGGLDDHKLTINIDGRTTDWERPSPPLTVMTGTIPGGWTMEIAIPRSHLHPLTWQAGTNLGFDWSLHDDDDGGDWDSYLIWLISPFMSNAAGLGNLRLMGSPITLQTGASGSPDVADTYIDAWTPNTNFSNTDFMAVRAPDYHSPLLRFPLDGFLPQGVRACYEL